MSTTLSPKELERKAFRSTFQDGIWDIYLGLLLLLMGVSTALTRITELRENQLVLIMLISAVVIMAVFFLGKKYITAPRLGRAKFGEERKVKMKKVRLALSLSALLGLVLFFGHGFIRDSVGGLPGWVIPLGLFGFSAVTVFSVGAYYLDFSRAYYFGWCYALAFPVGIFLQEYTQWGLAISYLVFSSIIIIPGIVLFFRFLREYPIPAEGEGGTI